MKRFTAPLLGFALALGVVRANILMEDPVEVTKAAYRTALAHFGFAPDTVRQEKAYLTPDLYTALMKKANQPVPKGDAPDIEGDVFFDAQDVPDKYVVGYAYGDYASTGKASVPVQMRWGHEERLYYVHLVRIDGAWKISDVDYVKDGKLSDLLK